MRNILIATFGVVLLVLVPVIIVLSPYILFRVFLYIIETQNNVADLVLSMFILVIVSSAIAKGAELYVTIVRNFFK
jgi:hypothetical protein